MTRLKVTALSLFAAGCVGGSSANVPVQPAQVQGGNAGPPVEVIGEVKGQKAEPAQPADPKKDTTIRATRLAFEASVLGKTRDEIEAKYGVPPKHVDAGPLGGWDGPASVYYGEFADEDGKKVRTVSIYFRSSESGRSVAKLVTFWAD